MKELSYQEANTDARTSIRGANANFGPLIEFLQKEGGGKPPKSI